MEITTSRSSKPEHRKFSLGQHVKANGKAAGDYEDRQGIITDIRLIGRTTQYGVRFNHEEGKADDGYFDSWMLDPVRENMNNDIGMPKCKMCGHRRPAGRYQVVMDVGGTRRRASEYVCNPCWRLLNKGGREGHLFRATRQRWWLYQHLGGESL